MSDKNNNKTMDPAHFEAFIKEIASRMGEFEISSGQTVDFFNEAIRHVKQTFPNTDNIEEFDNPETEDRPWIKETQEED